MNRPAISAPALALLLLATPGAYGTTIIVISETKEETIGSVNVGDIDSQGKVTGFHQIMPDAMGRYLLINCGTVCPDAKAYTAPDGGDQFTLSVETSDVFLQGFSSEAGDNSPEESGETMLIPTFSLLSHDLPGPEWPVVITSPCEGTGLDTDEADPPASCSAPEASSWALLCLGCGALVLHRWYVSHRRRFRTASGSTLFRASRG